MLKAFHPVASAKILKNSTGSETKVCERLTVSQYSKVSEKTKLLTMAVSAFNLFIYAVLVLLLG